LQKQATFFAQSSRCISTDTQRVYEEVVSDPRLNEGVGFRAATAVRAKRIDDDE